MLTILFLLMFGYKSLFRLWLTLYWRLRVLFHPIDKSYVCLKRFGLCQFRLHWDFRSINFALNLKWFKFDHWKRVGLFKWPGALKCSRTLKWALLLKHLRHSSGGWVGSSGYENFTKFFHVKLVWNSSKTEILWAFAYKYLSFNPLRVKDR